MTVTASISTKGRTQTTLPLAIQAIALQTVRPKQLVIFDDNEEMKDLQQVSPYCHLFPLLMTKGIQWFHFQGQRIGQVANHASVLAHADTEFVWRCFMGTEKVETEEGLRNIREIRVGDLVKTHLGNLKRVTKVHKTSYPQRKPLILIKTKYSTIRCTPEHPILINEAGTFTQAQNLKPGMNLYYPDAAQEDMLHVGCAGRRTLDGHVSREGGAINIKDLSVDKDLARFLGLYLAEGCGGHDSIRFTFGNHEDEYVNFVARVCREKFNRTPTIHRRWATTVKLNIRTLSAIFLSWFGKKAPVKRIPEFVFKWTLQNKVAFILGYLDGDGWSHGKVGRRFGTASKQLYLDLRRLLISCGLSCSEFYSTKPLVNVYKGKEIIGKGGYQGTIHKATMEKLLDLFNARRATEKFLEIPVVSVERRQTSSLKDQHVYNLTVERDNTYIVGPAVVHNCDDDNVPQPDCLEKLLKVMQDPQVGAVGGLVHDPKAITSRPTFLTGKIEDIYSLNIQWYQWSGAPEEVDHLYSTFLYRVEAGRKAGGYSKLLSPVGHREETMFTHEIKRAGYKLFVTPEALTWHLREGKGGIRSYTDGSLWDRDEKVFVAKLAEWGVKPRECKFIVLNNGLGDHFMFKAILPEIMAAHQGKRIILATCFPEVFLDVPGIEQASIADAIAAYGNLDQWDIYRWCEEKDWKRSFPDAMRELYR